MMKRSSSMVMAALLTMAIYAGTFAQCATKAGNPGATHCAPNATVAPEMIQKFNKETKALQMQLIDKQALLKKEFLNDDPNPDSVASIRKAIIDIEKEMFKTAKKLGMKTCPGACGMLMGGYGCGGGCGGSGTGEGHGCGGHGGMHGGSK